MNSKLSATAHFNAQQGIQKLPPRAEFGKFFSREALENVRAPHAQFLQAPSGKLTTDASDYSKTFIGWISTRGPNRWYKMRKLWRKPYDFIEAKISQGVERIKSSESHAPVFTPIQTKIESWVEMFHHAMKHIVEHAMPHAHHKIESVAQMFIHMTSFAVEQVSLHKPKQAH